MKNKNLFVGLVIGVLIGAGAMYLGISSISDTGEISATTQSTLQSPVPDRATNQFNTCAFRSVTVFNTCRKAGGSYTDCSETAAKAFRLCLLSVG